ncbi:MOSC domain-containing protein [Spirillospora sp. NPDC048911]|uniref:MOSC domain-containing protein n=1 Tax=Spirillospora sp. NPDC048911 TaxID=3364527 RepID=UPI003721C7B9
MRISELWRYPVKSLGGQRVTDLRLGPRGVIGDRAFALIDTRDKVLTAKRVPLLLHARARLRWGEVEIVLPTGIRVHSSDPAVDTILSTWLGRPVHLQADEGFVDESPLHLLTRASLHKAREWHPKGAWEVRRFRPNIVLEGQENPTGTVDIGQARIHITGPCPRCVMVTHAQEGLPKDRAILRTLTTHTAATLGVYAEVKIPGQLSQGDQATPTPALTNAAAS